MIEPIEAVCERSERVVAEMRAVIAKMDRLCTHRARLAKEMEEIEARFAQRKLATTYERENSHN